MELDRKELRIGNILVKIRCSKAIGMINSYRIELDRSELMEKRRKMKRKEEKLKKRLREEKRGFDERCGSENTM